MLCVCLQLEPFRFFCSYFGEQAGRREKGIVSTLLFFLAIRQALNCDGLAGCAFC